MLTTHPPGCSLGWSPLKWAIDRHEPDAVALLHSVGAAE